jgi:Domain of unknown function (DUF4383)
MTKRRISTIQKIAWGYAVLFLGVYALDYVPGTMDENGKMFGLFSMTPMVDAGHLAMGALAVIGALAGKRAARWYFWLLGLVYAIDVIQYVFLHLGKISPMTNFMVNLPHILISLSALLIAALVDKGDASAVSAAA